MITETCTCLLGATFTDGRRELVHRLLFPTCEFQILVGGPGFEPGPHGPALCVGRLGTIYPTIRVG
jgi:hypothetical protein